MGYTRLIVHACILMMFPAISFALDFEYPTNEVERPLTLPKSVVEISGAWNYTPREYYSDYSTFNIRYGITDTFEIYSFGLKDRFLFLNGKHELALIAVMLGSSTEGVSAKGGFEGKWRAADNAALVYSMDAFTNPGGEIKNETKWLFGGIYSFSDKTSITLQGAYWTRQVLQEDSTSMGDGIFNDYIIKELVARLGYNYSARVDLFMEGRYSIYPGTIKMEGITFVDTNETFALGAALRF